MFNIIGKIYAELDSELDISKSRCIVIHPRYHDVGFDIEAQEQFTKQVGVIFQYNSIEDMLQDKFNNSYSEWYEWIKNQDTLYVVCEETTYIRLFAQRLAELQKTFKVSDEQITKIKDVEILKELTRNNTSLIALYRNNESTNILGFNDIFDAEYKQYTPTGTLYSKSNIEAVSFELAAVLYRWKYITKTTIDKKVAAISERLLKGQIHNICECGKICLAQSSEIIRRYFDDDSIEGINNFVDKILGDQVLRRLIMSDYNHMDMNLDDPAQMAKILKFCYAVIDTSPDFDKNPDVDKEEFQLYVDLYHKNDFNIIEKARYNFVGTGFIAARTNRFNSLLFMLD